MIFINTRPKNRSQNLTEAMQAKGLQVLEFPLLELTPIMISHREQQYQATMIGEGLGAKPYKALVVISPTAASLGMQNCPRGFIPNFPVIAVGDKTAEVLRNNGWQVGCPDEASNEGMMRMPELALLNDGDKVLVWRGRGGRRLLSNYLQDKGIVVDAIAWYQRQCPIDANKKIKDLQQQLHELLKECPLRSNPIVLVSSGEAFTNWRLLLSESDIYTLDSFQYLTFGHRLTHTLDDLNLVCTRIDNLDPNEVSRGIQSLQK